MLACLYGEDEQSVSQQDAVNIHVIYSESRRCDSLCGAVIRRISSILRSSAGVLKS